MENEKLRLECWKFLGSFGQNIFTKFRNVCGKTGQYNVPNELYQKRTNRKNRVLIEWQTVLKNNLTIKDLESFENGVVVEFVNNDIFNPENKNNETFNELVKRLGSNNNVSSMISIHTQEGNSNSEKEREAYKKLINSFRINYNGQEIELTKDNIKDYFITRDKPGNTKNNNWHGFLYISIKGGQQDTIESHKDKNELLFNPACEYANEKICEDIDLVMIYFALKSITNEQLASEPSKQLKYKSLLKKVEDKLKSSYYKNPSYEGNLYDYVTQHISLNINSSKLVDPIQMMPITTENFNKNKIEDFAVDFTHNEPVNKNKYYYDEVKKCILGPCRPTNIFWSFHISNMMQQNYTLDEFFKMEEKRVERRKKLIKDKTSDKQKIVLK